MTSSRREIKLFTKCNTIFFSLKIYFLILFLLKIRLDVVKNTSAIKIFTASKTSIKRCKRTQVGVFYNALRDQSMKTMRLQVIILGSEHSICCPIVTSIGKDLSVA